MAKKIKNNNSVKDFTIENLDNDYPNQNSDSDFSEYQDTEYANDPEESASDFEDFDNNDYATEYSDETSDDNNVKTEKVSRSHSEQPKKKKRKKKKKSSHSGDMIFHISFGVIAFILITVSVILLVRWSKGKDLVITDADITEEYEYESIDHFSYFSPYDVEGYEDDGELNIVYMCDEYTYANDGTNDIPSMIANATGANVTVLYLPKQLIACKSLEYDSSYPEDAFSFYRTTTQITSPEENPFGLMFSGSESMGDLAPACEEYCETISSVDFDKVDVLVIALGTNDFFSEIPLVGSDITANNQYGEYDGFSGAYARGIGILKDRYPAMQIIISSPALFYVENTDGTYTAAYDLKNNTNSFGEFICGMEIAAEYKRVTFVDNFFGAQYSEEHFAEYLDDNKLYPNENGRQIIADHIVSYMYFNKNTGE